MRSMDVGSMMVNKRKKIGKFRKGDVVYVRIDEESGSRGSEARQSRGILG